VPVLAWRMFRAALAKKPDVIHLFKPKGYGGVAAMFQIALTGIGLRLPPLFLDTDDWEGTGGMNELHSYSGPEKRFYQFQEQWITKRAAGVTVASRALEGLVAEMGIEPGRLLYLPNCVSESGSGDGRVARRRFGIPKAAPVVLLYTRFFEFPQEKLYRLFEQIQKRAAGVRFLVIGKGRSGEEGLLVSAAKDRGFADSLVLAGWIEPADLPDCLAAGDVAVYPFADNLVNRTKCPAKLTELLLAGRPVVADRVGQLAEYIQDGVSGVLCDPDDWEDMAARVVALLDDPVSRQRLGLAARAVLLEKFNWSNAAWSLHHFYLGTANPFQRK
jgi:glycosyltransferase involved in cell wall biosynthesis